MINKTKALGLAFIAAAAMSAAAASAAQAGSFDFGAQPTVITAHSDPGQEHIFTFPFTAIGGNLSAKCPTASYEGTAQGLVDVTEVTVTATFGANAAGVPCRVNGLNAVVRMNGCKYTLTGAGQPEKTFLVDIAGCTAGKQIEIVQTATGCVVSIPEQNGLPHVFFDQINSQQLTETVTLTGITFTFGATCPEAGHHGSNASLTGSTAVKTFVDAGTAQVTKHNHQYSEHKCGAQVSLTAT